MTKTTLIILGFLQFSLTLKSQEKILLYYNSDWEITRKENATHFRESEYDLNNFKLHGKVLEYNSLDTLSMEGNYLNGKRNGVFVFYFKNGNIKSKGIYKNNKRVGKWEYFYANSRLKQVIIFPQNGERLDFAVVEYYDRNNNQLIKNGTGNWINDSIKIGLFDHSSLKKLTGQFKDTLKHGRWNLIRISDNKLMHTERFRKGRFIKAVVYNDQSNYYGSISSETLNKFPDDNLTKLKRTENFNLDTTVFSKSLLYSDVETIFKTVTGKMYKIKTRNAGYIYGDYSLLEFIGENLQYPISAAMKSISGKVYVNVVIDSLGNTKEVKILKGIHNDLDMEAIRVIQLITDWLPAIQNGEAIESTITIPIRFVIKE